MSTPSTESSDQRSTHRVVLHDTRGWQQTFRRNSLEHMPMDEALEKISTLEAEKLKRAEEVVRASERVNEVVVVAGGSGQLGRATAREARMRGAKVYITSRSEKTDTENLDGFHYIRTRDPSNPQEWAMIFRALLEEGDRLTVVNAIGGAHGDDIWAQNFEPVDAMLLALEAQQNTENIHMVSFSSISAPLLDDTYGMVKRATEIRTLESSIFTTIARVGYALRALQKLEDDIAYLNNEHDYSPEHFSRWVVMPMLGSGDQYLQPVIIEDIVEAALNAPNHLQVAIANAVSSQPITQKDFFAFFKTLEGRRVRSIHLSLEFAEALAKLFARGHFAPYAVEYLKMGDQDQTSTLLCPRNFETLLGRESQTLETAYSNEVEEAEEVYSANSPIVRHGFECVKEILMNANVRRELVTTMMTKRWFHR